METERAEGIVLRCQPVTESSLIVTWYTREWGKLKTVAKGARRAKGPFRGKIDLFYRDEIVFLRSRRSDLHLLNECFLEEARRELRGSVEELTAASYVCELVDLATEVEDANAAVFDLLEDVLGVLPGGNAETLLVWFELRLMTLLGWAPRWGKDEGLGKVMGALTAKKVDGVRRVRLTEAQVREARRVLWGMWDESVGRMPRTRKCLQDEDDR